MDVYAAWLVVLTWGGAHVGLLGIVCMPLRDLLVSLLSLLPVCLLVS